jgi:hypothetical protein
LCVGFFDRGSCGGLALIEIVDPHVAIVGDAVSGGALLSRRKFAGHGNRINEEGRSQNEEVRRKKRNEKCGSLCS